MITDENTDSSSAFRSEGNRNKKKIKIFIGLREVAGFFKSLKSGFDELGIESVFADLGGQPFNYVIENNPLWLQHLNSTCRFLSKFSHKSVFLRILWLGVFQNLISIFLFFWAIFSYNVFIFTSNSTFFFYLDLLILKCVGKKIIYVFVGSESRPLYISGRINVDTSLRLNLAILLTKLQKRLVNHIERYADFVVSIHPQALFHEKKFISILTVGFPCNIKRQGAVSRETESSNVRILHAPSNRKFKGSDVFLEIIGRLKKKGLPIEYVEITNKSNREVLEEISQCDFVIDELYSDTPLGGISTEAAFLGKPAVIGSYYASYIRDDIPDINVPPSVFCEPDNIEAAIERLIVDKKFRNKMGEEAYNYVHEFWAPKIVARKYLRLIDNDYPDSWLSDPSQIRYIYGVGLSKESIRKNAIAFINKKGIDSLCLTDKPHLEQNFIELIGQKS